MKVLNIVESAYRATLEEQDDTVVWIAHALRGAGADIDVLLQHNAVNYGIKAQTAAGLRFGAKEQTQPPALADDVTKLMGKGVTVYIVDDDLAARGIGHAELVAGLTSVARADIPEMLARYDQVWHW